VPDRALPGGRPPVVMAGLPREPLLAALTLAVMALFVASGYAAPARWRRRLRLAAIVAFVAALVAALAGIALWWAGGGP
jgi:multisubunit Na+/H+ antiporter MnhB subunit